MFISLWPSYMVHSISLQHDVIPALTPRLMHSASRPSCVCISIGPFLSKGSILSNL